MVKQIILDFERRQEIATTFGVSRQTVWAALSFKTNSGKAKVLRAAARERGGVTVNFDLGSAENTTFDTYWSEVPHQMIQVFSDKVRLVIDIKSSQATIEVEGEEVLSSPDVSLDAIPLLQATARKMVSNLN